MRENINKVSQRGERLDSLQDKTDNLAVSAQGFRRGANRVRKQMCTFSVGIKLQFAMTNEMNRVEGYEDENVLDCRNNHPDYRDRRPSR